MTGTGKVVLSPEQQDFIERAREGRNILVNACIGSGKTTAIQRLCEELPANRKILYLTYNKLLKLDAKSKIHNRNAVVNNYHGFAYTALQRVGKRAGVSDLIQCFLQEKPPLGRIDVLIIDEYQDIEQELAELLLYVKSTNPRMQVVAVGDMEQKIYDKTTLDVERFIGAFLGDHVELEFTRCFRLSSELAGRLGRIWNKRIVGVNPNCRVEEMTEEDVVRFLAGQNPRDILCLGARTGKLARVLNRLEEEYPAQFNKNTVYASISDRDTAGAVTPDPTAAIFTTFDSSKGLERKICVIFDYTESYWNTRISKPQQSYAILRNIFCVAASRGKERIIFVNGGEAPLSERTLAAKAKQNEDFENVDISGMFDFKYKEDIEACYSLLKVKRLAGPGESPEIQIENKDGLIDLSPCIGIYQEAVFFDGYRIDEEIRMWLALNRRNAVARQAWEQLSLDEKILLLVSMETKQSRYRVQVRTPFVNREEHRQIVERLGTLFVADEAVQARCSIDFSDRKNGELLFSAMGFADVIKDKVVYELKFVSELMHEHFLQCASYMVALGLKKGILWNTRDNSRYEICIPKREKYLDAVARAVSKGRLEKYYSPKAARR